MRRRLLREGAACLIDDDENGVARTLPTVPKILSAVRTPPKKRHESMPLIFPRWERRTDKACYWCCHTFETVPVPCPYRFDELRHKLYCHGTYCSFGCAFADAYYTRGHTRGCKESQLLRYLFRQCGFGLHEEITMAPHRHQLRLFGGTMSIEEFRASTPSPLLTVPRIYPLAIFDQETFFTVSEQPAPTTPPCEPPSENMEERARKLKEMKDRAVLQLERQQPVQPKNNHLLSKFMAITNK